MKTVVLASLALAFVPLVAHAEETRERGAQQEATEVTVVESREHGAYLADAHGRALYVLEEDPEGESTCYEECERVWPPFLTIDGEPKAAGEDVDDALLGTIKREDGFLQITYNDQPLYYYRQDEGPRQASGQDVTDLWGEWYLVSPRGEPVHHEEEDQEPGGGSSLEET